MEKESILLEYLKTTVIQIAVGVIYSFEGRVNLISPLYNYSEFQVVRGKAGGVGEAAEDCY